jgi:hypothetical protein
MAICNPLSSNDLRVADFRFPPVYFRPGRAPCLIEEGFQAG